MKGFIYCIRNNVNKKIYIGKTTKTLEERWKIHVRDSKKINKEIRPLYRAFNKYGIDKFYIELIEECDISILSEREIYWIDYYKTNKTGYNATFGGDGKILYDYNKIIETYNIKKNMKQTANELKCCTDTVKKVLISAGIKIETPIVGNCNKQKPIAAYDKNKNLVQSFKSVADASHWVVNKGKAKKYNSGVRSHIAQCANGKTKMAYSYFWKYI